MSEPTVTLTLGLSGVNTVLNALAQVGNTVQNTQQLIQNQAQQQLSPPPAAANDSNVVELRPTDTI